MREALRILTAQNLIRTTKGAGGGSYVTLPTVDHISEFLRGNLNLLSESDHVTLEEFLELRELIEVPAARLAAAAGERRTTSSACASRFPSSRCGMTTQEQFVYNKGFHTVIVEASGEHAPLHRHAARLHRAPDAPGALDARPELPPLDRTSIIAASSRRSRPGDADAAAAEMHDHLEYLRPALRAGLAAQHRRMRKRA